MLKSQFIISHLFDFTSLAWKCNLVLCQSRQLAGAEQHYIQDSLQAEK